MVCCSLAMSSLQGGLPTMHTLSAEQGMPRRKARRIAGVSVKSLRAPDAVGIACAWLGACCHLCGVQAVVRCNVHPVQALKGEVVLVSVGVDVESGRGIACQPLALLEAPCELARCSLPPLDVNDLLCLCLGPFGIPFFSVPA